MNKNNSYKTGWGMFKNPTSNDLKKPKRRRPIQKKEDVEFVSMKKKWGFLKSVLCKNQKIENTQNKRCIICRTYMVEKTENKDQCSYCNQDLFQHVEKK